MLNQSPHINDLTSALLNAYFDGTLPEGMAAWIERQLADDDDLRREVEAHGLAIAAIRERGSRDDAQLSEALQNVTHKELEQLLACLRDQHTAVPPTTLVSASIPPAASQRETEKQKPTVRRWLVTMLAAAALMSGVWFGARMFYRNQGAQDTADTYIATKTASTTPRGQARGADEPLAAPIDYCDEPVLLDSVAPQYTDVEMTMAQAEHLLQNKLYKEAIALLEPIYRDSGGQRDVGLMLASAYIKANERDKAQDVLQALAEHYEGDSELEALTKAYNN